MNLDGIEGDFHQTLWAVAANFENNTNNMMVNCDDNACPYQKKNGTMPSFFNNLQAFGQIGIAKNGNKIIGKMHNKEKICMMLRYAPNNAAVHSDF